MKVRLDENLSHRVAGALKAFLSDRTGLLIDWVRDHNPPGTKDPTWIRAFGEEGGHVIVSGDANILQHWPDLIAYMESELIAFFPPPGFDKLRGYGQASLILRWWPAIIEKAKATERGSCWRFPMTWTPDVTRFEALKDPRVATADKRAEHGVRAIETVHQFRK